MCDIDTVFRALADKRRRQVLCCLQEHRRVALCDLAERIVEEEVTEDVREVPAKLTSEVYFSLYHTHVPALEDAALVEYNQEHDLVSSTERFDVLLSQIREEVTGLLRA